MESEDALSTLAEISIGLAGFSTIVAVFQRGPLRDWSREELNSVWLIMELSFGLLVLSVLPLARWSSRPVKCRRICWRGWFPTRTSWPRSVEVDSCR